MRLKILLFNFLPFISLSLYPILVYGEWGVERDEKPVIKKGKRYTLKKEAPSSIEKYKSYLRTHPDDSFVIDKLYNEFKSRNGDIISLIEEYKKECEVDKSLSSYIILSQLLVKDGRREEGIRWLEQAILNYPNSPILYEKLGELLRTIGKNQEAISYLKKGLDLYRDNQKKVAILKELIKLEIEEGDIEEGRKYFKELLLLHSSSIYMKLYFAELLEKKERYEEAEAELKRLLKEVKGEVTLKTDFLPYLYKKLTEVEIKRKNYKEALAYIKEALNLIGIKNVGIKNELLTYMVDVYRELGDLKDGVVLLERYGRENPKAKLLLGQLYEELGELEKALSIYKSLCKGGIENSIEGGYKTIQVLKQLGRIKETLPYYEKLVRLSGGDTKLIGELAEVYESLGLIEKGKKFFTLISRLSPNNIPLHTLLHDIFLKWNDKARASHESTLIARLIPKDEEHIISLGEHYYKTGNLDKAKKVWERVLTLYPPPKSYELYSDILLDHNFIEEAITYIEKGLEIEPQNMRFQKKLARLYELKGEYSSSSKYWEKILRESTTPSDKREAIVHLVINWKKVGNLKESISRIYQEFRKNRDLFLGILLCEGYLKLEMYKKVEEVATLLLEQYPKEIEVLNLFLKLYQRQNLWEKGIDVLKKMAEVDPQNSYSYYISIADHYLKLYNESEALLYGEKAVELSPQNYSIHLKLASLYEKLQNWEKAIYHYSKVIELNNYNYEAYISLAKLYQWVGSPRQAIDVYINLLKLHPEDNLLKEAGYNLVYLGITEEMREYVERNLLALSVKAIRESEKEIYKELLFEMYKLIFTPILYKLSSNNITYKEKKETINLLKEIGKRALPSLIGALSSKKGKEKEFVIEVLGYISDSQLFQSLVEYITSPKEDIKLKTKVVVALSNIEDERVERLLQALYQKEKELELRSVILWAIGKVAKKLPLNIIKECITESEPPFAIICEMVIGKWKAKGFYDVLEKRLTLSTPLIIRGGTIFSIGLTQDSYFAETVLNLIKDKRRTQIEKELSILALTLIGRKDELELKELLKALLSNNDTTIYTLVRWYLMFYGKEENYIQELTEHIYYLGLKLSDVGYTYDNLIIYNRNLWEVEELPKDTISLVIEGIIGLLKEGDLTQRINSLELLSRSLEPIIKEEELKTYLESKNGEETLTKLRIALADRFLQFIRGDKEITPQELYLSTLILTRIIREGTDFDLKEILKQVIITLFKIGEEFDKVMKGVIIELILERVEINLEEVVHSLKVNLSEDETTLLRLLSRKKDNLLFLAK